MESRVEEQGLMQKKFADNDTFLWDKNSNETYWEDQGQFLSFLPNHLGPSFRHLPSA